MFLLRHGKSKRGPEYETDFGRPLAKRGRRDAASVGEYLAEDDLLPDLILSSPAERARQTTLCCVEAADYMGQVRFEESLYSSGEDAYLELLWNLDDSVGAVLFVGHNPDTESTIEALSGQYARMPTAGLARIDISVESWSEVREGGGQLTWVQLPRDL